MDEIMKAKAKGWEFNDGLAMNVVMDGELTVTITLGEYRTLISETAEITTLRLSKYAADRKVEELTKEVENLRAELDKICGGD